MSQHHHHHQHRPGDSHHHHPTSNLAVAFFLNFSFTIVEIIGGYLTGSFAILADAVHDLGDSFSLGFAWYMERFSRKISDEKFSFGYRRFSLLGGVVTSLVLVGGSIAVIFSAIPRLAEPADPYAPGMTALAVLGIIVNGTAMLRVKKGTSHNERLVSWHLLEDLLGWVAVLIVSIVLLFWDVPILDPILSIIISSWVLFNVMRSVKSMVYIFLQGVPVDVDVEELAQTILEIEQIQDVHHFHVWSLDGERNVLSVHIILDDEISRDEIIKVKNEIRQLSIDRNVSHVTVEIEYSFEDRAMADLEY